MIRASMTAYSTAVGPSSRVRNSTTRCVSFTSYPLFCFRPRVPTQPRGRPGGWGKPGSRAGSQVRSTSTLARDGGAHAREGVVGVLAEGGDGADADHDDQGQHDGVLDGGRAVFTLQEVHDRFRQVTHCSFVLCSLKKH